MWGLPTWNISIDDTMTRSGTVKQTNDLFLYYLSPIFGSFMLATSTHCLHVEAAANIYFSFTAFYSLCLWGQLIMTSCNVFYKTRLCLSGLDFHSFFFFLTLFKRERSHGQNKPYYLYFGGCRCAQSLKPKLWPSHTVGNLGICPYISS